MIKSPLNYIGGKYKLLPQILPLFPKNINNFVDLFCGGLDVSINVNAKKYYANDNLIFLIQFYKKIKELTQEEIINHIDKKIQDFGLSKTNEEGFKNIRRLYNQEKNPLDLFVLITHSFNHQIRFNNNHEYNNPFGWQKSGFNVKMRKNLFDFIVKLKEIDIIFTDRCFTQFDFSFLNEQDLVYCDPPYLIAMGTYNDSKRGFKGWGATRRKRIVKNVR